VRGLTAASEIEVLGKERRPELVDECLALGLLVRGCPYNALSGVFELSVTRVDPCGAPQWLPRWLPRLSTMDAASPLPQTVSLPRRNCSAHAVRRSPRRQLVGRRTTRGGPVSAVTSWAVSRCAHSCALSSVDRVPRVYGYCGDIPPTETETAYYARNRAQPTAEFSNREVSGHTRRFSVSCCRGCGGRVAVKVVMASATACGLRRGADRSPTVTSFFLPWRLAASIM